MYNFITLEECQYQGVSMGVYIDLDAFQEKNSMLFPDMIHMCVYMYNLLIIINFTFKNCIDILDEILVFVKAPALSPMQVNLSGTSIMLGI